MKKLLLIALIWGISSLAAQDTESLGKCWVDNSGAKICPEGINSIAAL